MYYINDIFDHLKFQIACHNLMQIVLSLPSTTPVIDKMYYIHDTITIFSRHLYDYMHIKTNIECLPYKARYENISVINQTYFMCDTITLIAKLGMVVCIYNSCYLTNIECLSNLVSK